MKTIWKFEMHMWAGEHQRFRFPPDSKILTFQDQRDVIVGWFETTPENTLVERTFAIVGTGHYVPENGVYCATVQTRAFAWHIYEVVE